MPLGKLGNDSKTQNSTLRLDSSSSAKSTKKQQGALGGVPIKAKAKAGVGAATLKQGTIKKASAPPPPSPARDVEHLEKIALKLFGPENHFKTSTPWIHLQGHILHSPVIQTIPFSKLQDIFDQLQAAGIKGHGFLEGKDLLSILKKLDAVVSGKPIDPTLVALKDERARLSKQLADTVKNITSQAGTGAENEFLSSLNEYQPKEVLEILLENYMADLPQAQVNTVMAKFDAYKDEAPAINRLQILLQTLNEATRAVKADNLDSLATTKFNLIPGAQIGEGANGKVFDVELDGQKKLWKEFKSGARPISLDMTDPSNPKLLRTPEVTASYLHPDELQTVVAPTHYLVSEKRKGSPSVTHLVEVRDKGFREWAKNRLLSNAGVEGYGLEITGSLQDYAKGVVLNNYLSSASKSEIQANIETIASSYLDALEVLSRRGFVHGDLKLENTFFDPATGKVSLIDTGGLAKISKKPARQEATKFDINRGPTVIYASPRVLGNRKAGFEQDIFSVGMQILDMLNVACFDDESNYQNLIDNINYEQDQVLNQVRQPRDANPKIQRALVGTLRHYKNPSHPLYKLEKLAFEAISVGTQTNKVLTNIELADSRFVAGNKMILASLKKILQ
jgi:serine/threonine protein kinase